MRCSIAEATRIVNKYNPSFEVVNDPGTDSDYQVRCPFHDDRTPSARVYRHDESLGCFTCHRSWTAVMVVAEGLSITRARARDLLKRFGYDESLDTASENLVRMYQALGGKRTPDQQIKDLLVLERVTVNPTDEFLMRIDQALVLARSGRFVPDAFINELRQMSNSDYMKLMPTLDISHADKDN